MNDPKLPTIGWREYLALPELGIEKIKAKIDTGARSSALHAFDLETFEQDGKQKVRFKVHPNQKDTQYVVSSEAEILDKREVRNSGGQAELRIFIQTIVELRGHSWAIELTLTNRDAMGFRMLLGRQGIRGKFLVDTDNSFIQSDQGMEK